MADPSILQPVEGDPFNEATVTTPTDSPIRATWDKYAGQFDDWLAQYGSQNPPQEGAGFIGIPKAINRTFGLHGEPSVFADKGRELYHNWVSGPLSADNPQATAVSDAVHRITRGGTGDIEQDKADQDLAAGASLDAAGWLAMPGLGRAAVAADPGLGTIGGRVGARAFPKAQTALQHAELLEGMKVPNNDIYSQTGWRRGKEGTWEFEIPDTGLKTKAYDPAVHGTDPYGAPQAFKISDLVSHSLLERAYPEIAQNATVVFDPRYEGKSSAHAYIDPQSGTLAIALGKPIGILPGQQFPKEMIGSLLHEVGHGIGEIAEGRSPGGNPNIVKRKVGSLLEQAGYEPAEIKRAVWEYYRSLADETRQRVVQERFLNPDKAASEPYYQTAARMGYPEERQIIPPQSAAPGDYLGAGREAGTIIDQMKSGGLLAPKPVREILQGQLEKNNPQIPDNLRSSIDVWHGSPHEALSDEAKRQARMASSPYQTVAYHGGFLGREPGYSGQLNKGDFFSTESPELANLYTDRLKDDYKLLTPLRLDTSAYHQFDAAGKPLWVGDAAKAIKRARKSGAPGITVRNTLDEPFPGVPTLGQFWGFSDLPPLKLGPQTIHITFDKGKHTIRSPIAQFDPAKYGQANLLYSSGVPLPAHSDDDHSKHWNPKLIPVEHNPFAGAGVH